MLAPVGVKLCEKPLKLGQCLPGAGNDRSVVDGDLPRAGPWLLVKDENTRVEGEGSKQHLTPPGESLDIPHYAAHASTVIADSDGPGARRAHRTNLLCSRCKLDPELKRPPAAVQRRSGAYTEEGALDAGRRLCPRLNRRTGFERRRPPGPAPGDHRRVR